MCIGNRVLLLSGKGGGEKSEVGGGMEWEVWLCSPVIRVISAAAAGQALEGDDRNQALRTWKTFKLFCCDDSIIILKSDIW